MDLTAYMEGEKKHVNRLLYYEAKQLHQQGSTEFKKICRPLTEAILSNFKSNC